MTAKEAITEFFDEIIKTIDDCDYQFNSREEMLIEIKRGINKTMNDLLIKCEN